jgi:hypothetical protein
LRYRRSTGAPRENSAVFERRTWLHLDQSDDQAVIAEISLILMGLLARPKRGGDDHANTMYFLKNFGCLPRI